MKKLFTLYFCLFSFASICQNESDSLWQGYNNVQQADANRINAIYQLSRNNLQSEPDSALRYAKLFVALAEAVNNKKMMGRAINLLGILSYRKSNFEEALDYYQISQTIAKEVGDLKGLSNLNNNIGLIHYDQGNFNKAIINYTKSLKIKEEIGDLEGVGNSLINIGLLYNEQEEYEKSIENYKRSLAIFEKLNDPQGISNSLNNLGMTYADKGDNESAIDFYTRSLKIKEQLNNKEGLSITLNNIGTFYEEIGNNSKAIEFYERSLKIAEELEYKSGISRYSNNIGICYNKLKNLPKAKIYCTNALTIAQEIGDVFEIRSAANSLYGIYSAERNFQKALTMYKLFVKMQDSIQNDANRKQVIRQEFKYKYEKQAAADSVKSAEAQKVADSQIATQQAELIQQQTQRYALYGGIIILLLFGGFIFNRYKVSQTQKNTIQHQKLLVDKKNTEILDSINYAKRIQDAILPSTKLVKEYLTESFILYQPKDIVAGDFYWFDVQDKLVYFAAADCTGHGVPGAMVSVVCANALKRAVNELKLTEPSSILDKVREVVAETFEQSEEDVNDGMDISFCKLDLNSNKITFSGARNPLYRITPITDKLNEKTLTDENFQLIEYKGDRQPIGKYIAEKPFTQIEIQLEKNDVIYLSSDGFPDQFGGLHGKKLMYKPFKKILLNIHSKPMEQQKLDLINSFNDWKGNLEQIDDVCIVGVRV